MLPVEATKLILSHLPSRRMKDVIEKRFGLKGGRSKTLDGIGREYKITRERVRQIEADALKHLRKEENLAEIKPLLVCFGDHLKKYGEVMAEQHLFDTLALPKHHPHLALLLGLEGNFQKLPETDDFHPRWTANLVSAEKMDKVFKGVVGELDKLGSCVSKTKLDDLLTKYIKDFLGTGTGVVADLVATYLTASKVIGQNPYGEYGLIHWPTISPRGIRDKAYLALAKNGKAMHFLEIAKAINKVGWSKKKAHPQTVHNELIKDNRFVLVGRGLYALHEWGYEPGVVRDVMVSVLKNAGRPMAKEEIINVVTEKRFVKPPTVLLNLQNKSLFRKNDNGTYSLA